MASKGTQAQGRTLAVKMMDELANYESDADGWANWNINAEYRQINAPQDNVVLRHINAIQHDENLLAGFCAVITDYIARAENVGEDIDYRFYKKFSERDVTGKPGPWPRPICPESFAEDAPEFERFMKSAIHGADNSKQQR